MHGKIATIFATYIISGFTYLKVFGSVIVDQAVAPVVLLAAVLMCIAGLVISVLGYFWIREAWRKSKDNSEWIKDGRKEMDRKKYNQ